MLSVFFFPNFSTNIQALTVVLMLALFLHIQAKNEPYCETLLNKAEIFSRIVSLITIVGDLFFITDDLDSITEAILLILILLFNFIFIIYVAIQLLAQIYALKRCFRIIETFLHINKEKKYKVGGDSVNLNDTNYKNVYDRDNKLVTTEIKISNTENLYEFRDNEIASLELDPFSSEESALANN